MSADVRLLGRSCNAGFQRVGSACVSCVPGVEYRVSETLVEGGVQTPCQTCRACTEGQDYETSACLPWQNRVCSACRITCNTTLSERITGKCTVKADLQCAACAKQCLPGQYLNPGSTKCSGTTTQDTVLEGCGTCLKVSDCEPGKSYLSGNCSGTETKSNQCVVCQSLGCAFPSYSGGCGGYSPTQCLPLTRCPAGEFLNTWGETNDGVCQKCRNCTAIGLKTVTPCTSYQNAGCGGDACNATTNCVSTNNTIHYCDYLENVARPSCGICPVRVFGCFLCAFLLLTCVCVVCSWGTNRTASSAWSAPRG